MRREALERCLACEAVVNKEIRFVRPSIVCALYRIVEHSGHEPAFQAHVRESYPRLNGNTIERTTGKGLM